jgi:hypothetical protein
MELAYSSKNDPPLLLWAMKEILRCWKYEWYPELGQAGTDIFLMAATKVIRYEEGSLQTAIDGLAIVLTRSNAHRPRENSLALSSKLNEARNVPLRT